MTKIPKPTKEAIDECYNSIIKTNMHMLDNKEMREHLKKYHDKFKERQPGLYTYIEKICRGHEEMTKGLILAPQFFLYMMIAIDSLYVQEEIDDVEDIFKEGEENE